MIDDLFNIDKVTQTHARTQMFGDVGEQFVVEINTGSSPMPPVQQLTTKSDAVSAVDKRRPQYLVEDELPYIVLECLLGLKHGLGLSSRVGLLENNALARMRLSRS
ncbi:hypothetical protein G6M70_15795 [Agrobacterium tumefaciens]|uniref:hypothetical protein n=1 Tax=Agrobacterium tumefaciens TaxID=358 RepID=UPI00157328E5|nr:hypothetical protein [Agrobacterium tumefaciens]NSZ02378.1 hypothetical protein [Agrobacterium tumefaciens]NSZ39892.1 hypothetical protein [Agrobacterium tumefaciens]NTB22018.1 hypothetical protein [Agrobacterium tumefaciens]NTB30224.1 hypothetical protein [Agrobacterium tumefaciens]NTB34255.1 hypothetical protein [Agrobacterium tumefaciens]